MSRKSMMLALCFSLATATISSTAFAKGEPQPGDDRGRNGGKGKLTIQSKGEPQPGDDRGQHSGPHKLMAKGQPEPGDDRGGVNKHPQPGDDRGRRNG